jgi:hypothetical protein
MAGSDWPLLLIEGVLVLGGALAFGWWQLRDVEKDRAAARRQRAESATKAAPESAGDSADAGDGP